MLVTILTDASWCPETGATGYGYWIASSRGKRPGGNRMRVAEDATHAEMMAVVNGLTVALNAGLVEYGDDVLIQTDSTDAIAGLTGQRLRYESFTEAKSEVWEHFKGVVEQHQIRVSFRHVKGHSHRPEARFKANNHCDERAKKFMRQARRELRKQATDSWAKGELPCQSD